MVLSEVLRVASGPRQSSTMASLAGCVLRPVRSVRPLHKRLSRNCANVCSRFISDTRVSAVFAIQSDSPWKQGVVSAIVLS